LVLFDNLLWCQDKASSDPQFQEKYGLHLKVLARILKENSVPEELTLRYLKQLGNSFLKNLEGFLWNKRNILPTEKQLKGRFEVRSGKQSGTPLSQLPAPTYIGKGYRDKGTAKKPWIDGSPSWQEVAMQPIGDKQDG
jgi:hypothetical protein